MSRFPNPTAVPADPELARVIADVKALARELGGPPSTYYAHRGLTYPPIKAALLQACEELAAVTIEAIRRDDASLEEAHFVASFMGAMLHAFAYGMEYQRRRGADQPNDAGADPCN
jgi:hypothetical protein